jgi:hypothetical protein
VGLDDLISTETAFVAAATAAVFSPKTRDTLRKGAVYGVAGALKAGDVVAGAARGAVRGVRGDDAAASEAAAAASTPSAPTSSAPTPSAPTPSAAPARTARSSGARRTNSGQASTRRAAATTKTAGS